MAAPSATMAALLVRTDCRKQPEASIIEADISAYENFLDDQEADYKKAQEAPF